MKNQIIYRNIIFIIFLLCSCLSNRNTTENESSRIASSLIVERQSPIIAHRGYWSFEGSAENSIKSLQAAAELGIYGSEFDVHLTADNIPVIYHNYIIKDTDFHIQQVSYNVIKDATLPNGERLPTLDAYLEAGKMLSIQLILEIKPHATPERNREAARIVVDRVKHFGLEDRVDYITFSFEMGRELIRLQPDSNVGYLSMNLNLTPGELKEYGFSTLSYYYFIMLGNSGYFYEAKSLGLTIAAWTIDDFGSMNALVDRGTSFITTDRPQDAKEYFEQKVYQYKFYF